MKEKILMIEKKVYEFNNKEKQEILKRVLANREEDLRIYWDYRDNLNEEDINLILNEEDGLYDVENSLYENNISYFFDVINNIIEEELTEEEKTDKDLKEFLIYELESKININIDDLLKNSSVRVRIELNTNEDFMLIENFKRTEYYHFLKNVFKGTLKLNDLNKEIISMCGSNYGKIVFFFKVSGDNILKLREDIQRGFITLRKGIKGGIFNSWLGCGGDLELELNKDITLNIKNWAFSDNQKILGEKEKDSYYNISIRLDNAKKGGYGIQQTYGLVGECWEEY